MFDKKEMARSIQLVLLIMMIVEEEEEEEEEVNTKITENII